jgi:multiple sugar transport system permease protein
MATGIKQQDQQDAVAGWLFMTPTLVILGIFLLVPILFALFFSFTDWNGISPPSEAQWVGLQNFQTLLLDDGIRRADFFKALKNTAYFSLGVVPLQTAIALFLAVVINQRRLRFKDFFRTSYYLPAITSSIAISMLFLFLYQKNGLINQVLGWLTFGLWQPIAWMSESAGLFHIILGWFGITLATGPSWLENEVLSLTIWDWISGPSIALMAIMLMNTWTTIGTMMVIFLAALQDVPTPVYEAAEMDGATGWKTFTKITLPLVRPTLFFVVTLGLIGTFQVFDQVYVMSSGGPAKTTLTVAYLVYRNGFTNSQMGLAAAIALLLFIIIFTLTLVQRRITEGKKE